MQMNSVLTAFQNLCDTPIGWAMLALVSLKAAHSVISFLRCPLLRGEAYIDPEVAQARLDSPVLHSPRFMVSMLTGLTLAIGGLYTLQNPQIGHFAIAAIVLGVFIMLVEPSRLSIDENNLRVAAIGDAQGAGHEMAVDRLRAAHLERVAMEVLFAIGLGIVVAIY